MLSLVQVDAAVLQYQNQKLVQQLDSQKHELHDLEAKIKELKENQTSYDDMLITVNQLWNQVNFKVPFLFPFSTELLVFCSLDCLMGHVTVILPCSWLMI